MVTRLIVVLAATLLVVNGLPQARREKVDKISTEEIQVSVV